MSSIAARLEEVLAATAALGPRHAAYVEKYLRPGLIEYVEKSCGEQPAFRQLLRQPGKVGQKTTNNLALIATKNGLSAEEIRHFIIRFDQKKPGLHEKDHWLRPYLAEAAGFKSFAGARRELIAALIRVYPRLWQALSERPIPILNFTTKQVGIFDSDEPEFTRMIGGFDLSSGQIGLNGDALTLQHLLSRHPFRRDFPVLLTLGLDPCLQNFLYKSPRVIFRKSALHTLLHECLHAIEPFQTEKYRPSLHGVFKFENPDLKLDQILTRPLDIWFSFSNRQTGLPVGSILATPASRLDLMEGLTDRLADLKLEKITQIIADPWLSQEPFWVGADLSLTPVLSQFCYDAQGLVDHLTEEEIVPFRSLHPDLEGLLTRLTQNLLSEARAEALLAWLKQGDSLLTHNLATGKLKSSPELEALREDGWLAVARWLNLPAYTTPLVRIWQEI